uniref:Uncharacterized protein n=1 Tax=Zea mays TaxID=4577 RepID=A0A804MB27_MAIZE
MPSAPRIAAISAPPLSSLQSAAIHGSSVRAHKSRADSWQPRPTLLSAVCRHPWQPLSAPTNRTQIHGRRAPLPSFLCARDPPRITHGSLEIVAPVAPPPRDPLASASRHCCRHSRARTPPFSPPPPGSSHPRDLRWKPAICALPSPLRINPIPFCKKDGRLMLMWYFKPCLYMDAGLASSVTALRTCTDVAHLAHVLEQFRLA